VQRTAPVAGLFGGIRPLGSRPGTVGAPHPRRSARDRHALEPLRAQDRVVEEVPVVRHTPAATKPRIPATAATCRLAALQRLRPRAHGERHQQHADLRVAELLHEARPAPRGPTAMMASAEKDSGGRADERPAARRDPRPASRAGRAPDETHGTRRHGRFAGNRKPQTDRCSEVVQKPKVFGRKSEGASRAVRSPRGRRASVSATASATTTAGSRWRRLCSGSCRAHSKRCSRKGGTTASAIRTPLESEKAARASAAPPQRVLADREGSRTAAAPREEETRAQVELRLKAPEVVLLVDRRKENDASRGRRPRRQPPACGASARRGPGRPARRRAGSSGDLRAMFQPFSGTAPRSAASSSDAVLVVLCIEPGGIEVRARPPGPSMSHSSANERPPRAGTRPRSAGRTGRPVEKEQARGHRMPRQGGQCSIGIRSP